VSKRRRRTPGQCNLLDHCASTNSNDTDAEIFLWKVSRQGKIFLDKRFVFALEFGEYPVIRMPIRNNKIDLYATDPFNLIAIDNITGSLVKDDSIGRDLKRKDLSACKFLRRSFISKQVADFLDGKIAENDWRREISVDYKFDTANLESLALLAAEHRIGHSIEERGAFGEIRLFAHPDDLHSFLICASSQNIIYLMKK